MEENSKKNKKKLILIISLIVIIIAISVFAVIQLKQQQEYNKIKIELKESNVEIEYGKNLDVNEFLSKYEGGEIKIENNIDFNKVGEYKVIYTVISENGLDKTKELVVKITDTVSPIITLENEEIKVELEEEIDVLEGVTAEDNYDKDITDKIIVTGSVDIATEGTYEIKYDVQDSSKNNAETKTRTYVVAKNATLEVGRTYEWSGPQGGSTYTLKENNKVTATAWATNGGGSDYRGTYKIEGDKITISLTEMYDYTEWVPINNVQTFTITGENEFRGHSGVYKVK